MTVADAGLRLRSPTEAPRPRTGVGGLLPAFALAPETAEARSRQESGRVPLSRYLTSRSIWGLTWQALFKAAGYNFLVTFYPAFLEFAYELPKEETGTMTSWSLIGLVVGSLLGGWLIDHLQRRTGSKRLSRCGVAVVTMSSTAALMLAACFTATATQLAVVMAAAALVTGIGNTCPWAAIMDIGGKHTAVAMGCLNCGACLAGVLITPAVGKLIDRIRYTEGDWNLVIFLHAAFYLASALCWPSIRNAPWTPWRPVMLFDTSTNLRSPEARIYSRPDKE